MNILVCIKQVPDTTEIKIDPVKHTLIREGVPSIVNPFDAYALEAAARIKDKDADTKIVVMTMGPMQAEKALRECLAIAADKAYLVSGRTFGGSDTLATSYIISESVKKIEEIEGKFDAIFCGKQAIDGDTAQVGPEISEHLDYPLVTYGLECEKTDDGLKVIKEAENGTEVIGVKTPCVVTFTKPSFDPRFPTIRRKMKANKAEVPVIADTDITTIDPTRIGLKGSPTRVKSTYVPAPKQGGVVIEEKTAEESAAKLFGMLTDAHII